MKLKTNVRPSAALLVILCVLFAPLVTFAKKGDKNYKKGLEHETAQQWDRAAQEYALAVAAQPSNIEFQLHYRRALFNASQTFMQQGRTFAENGDYTAAYNAFRQAYGYDPVNGLAQSEMERMLRLQRDKEAGVESAPANTKGTPPSAARITPTAFQPNAPGETRVAPRGVNHDTTQTPVEPLRIVDYNSDLGELVKTLAGFLNMSVVFDQTFPKRQVSFSVKNVTAAQALDYLFLSQGLYFKKLSRRVILVADQQRRTQYQELALRNFFLNSADPTEVARIIQGSIPAQPGRPAQAPIINKATNSVIVRDTPENLRVIAEMVKSLDKDRAEVVMDVSIYEISRNDLAQFGNQFGTTDSLGNLGGLQTSSFLVGGAQRLAGAVAGATVPVSTGIGLLIPSSTFSALQSRNNTRLVYSTQLHAFDGEDSIAKIGQKIPLQTGSIPSYGGFSGTPVANTPAVTGTTGPVAAQGAFGGFGGGYPIINYTDIGLNLKFKPQVFPNLDVQVKMEIESSDSQAVGTNLTPTISQRTISGTARIPNNRTMMIASIAQNQESRGRSGLPILGLIPVLGRLFSTPTRKDIQSDIVIAVTPRVLRAPDVTPRDEETYRTGTLQSPTTETLEAMIQETEREEQLAAARQLPTSVNVQLPAAQSAAATTPTPQTATSVTTTTTAAPAAATTTAINRQANASTMTAANTTTAAAVATNVVAPEDEEPPAYVPAPKILMNNQALPNAKAVMPLTVPVFADVSSTPAPRMFAANTALSSTPLDVLKKSMPTAAAINTAELQLAFDEQGMRVGERRPLLLMLKTNSKLSSAAATLRFDARRIRIRSIDGGELLSNAVVSSSFERYGVVHVAIKQAAQGGTPITGTGVLLRMDVELISPGEGTIDLRPQDVRIVSADNSGVQLGIARNRVTLKPLANQPRYRGSSMNHGGRR